MGAQQFSVAAIYHHHAEKPTYQRWEIMTQKQETFMRAEINFALGKNGGYTPSNLGGRLISMGRQWVSEWVNETKFFTIWQLQFSEF